MLTLDEAIQLLEKLRTAQTAAGPLHTASAITLGIKALRLIQKAQMTEQLWK